VTVSAGAAAGASPASSKRRAAGLRFFGAPMTGLHLALLGAVTVLCGVKGLLPGAVVWAVYTFSQRSQGACRAHTPTLRHPCRLVAVPAANSALCARTPAPPRVPQRCGQGRSRLSRALQPSGPLCTEERVAHNSMPRRGRGGRWERRRRASRAGRWRPAAQPGGAAALPHDRAGRARLPARGGPAGRRGPQRRRRRPARCGLHELQAGAPRRVQACCAACPPTPQACPDLLADRYAHTAALRQAGGMSELQTLFNSVNAMCGIGLLAMPFALAEMGWPALALMAGAPPPRSLAAGPAPFCLAALRGRRVCPGSARFVQSAHCARARVGADQPGRPAAGVGSLFCVTGLLLGRCMDGAPWIRSYPDIGERAFGGRGRAAVAVMLYAELYLTAVDLLILAGDNLGALAPGFQPFGPRFGAQRAWTVAAAGLVLPSVWMRSPGALAWLSALGVAVSFGLTGLVGWEAAALDFPHARPPPPRGGGALLALGLVSFNFGGHALFPSLISAMRTRGAYPRVLGATFATVIAVYIAAAAVGYAAFGDAAMCAAPPAPRRLCAVCQRLDRRCMLLLLVPTTLLSRIRPSGVLRASDALPGPPPATPRRIMRAGTGLASVPRPRPGWAEVRIGKGSAHRARVRLGHAGLSRARAARARRQNVTLNMQAAAPAALPTRLAVWVVVVAPFTKFALIVAPIVAALEEALPGSGGGAGKGGGAAAAARSLGARTALVASTLAVAVLLPFFAYVMARAPAPAPAGGRAASLQCCCCGSSYCGRHA